MATHAANVRGYALVQDNAACIRAERNTYVQYIYVYVYIYTYIRNSTRRLYYYVLRTPALQWETGGQVRVRPHTWPS